MKRILWFSLFLLLAFNLVAQEREIKSYEIDFNAGLRLDFSRASVELGPGNTIRTLNYPFLALEIDVDILTNLTLGIVAGYNWNYFKDSVDFFQLPLSIRVNEEKNNSMVLGLNLATEVFSFGDFSILAKGEFLYFKLFKIESPIDLPIAPGTATVKNSFYQVTLDLPIEYYSFSGLILYAGPRLNLIKGKMTVDEQIGDIQAVESQGFKQKGMFDLMAGINVEIGSHLDLIFTASFFSKTSLAAGLFYLF